MVGSAWHRLPASSLAHRKTNGQYEASTPLIDGIASRSASWPWLSARSRLVATAAAEERLKFSRAVLRFAFWVAAYVVLGLLLAMFVQSLVNWLFS